MQTIREMSAPAKPERRVCELLKQRWRRFRRGSGSSDALTPDAATPLSDSPPSPGSWNNSSYANQEEQLTPEDFHIRGSESPQSTHLWKKRPYDIKSQDLSPAIPSVISSDSPPSAHTWEKRFVAFF